MAALKDLSVKIKLDNSDFKKGISETQSTTSSMSKSITSALKPIAGAVAGAFAVGAVVDFGKKCVMAAADLEQTMRKNKVIFGDMAGDVSEWALANERAFGLGAGTIEAMAGGLADLSQGMGVSKEDSMALAKEATNLSVALGNWNGTGAPEAMEDIKKAMTGNFTVLEKYGIKLNQSIMDEKTRAAGLGDSFAALDATAKQQLILSEVTAASSNAMDFFNEGNRSMAFLLNDVKEQFGNICEVIGTLFLPIVQELLAWVGDAVAWFAAWSAGFAENGIQCEWLMEVFKFFGEMLSALYENILKPVFDKWIEYGLILWEKFQEYLPAIQAIFQDVIGIIVSLWEDALRPAFEAIGAFIQNVLYPIWDTVFTYGILPVIDTVFSTIIKLWNNSLKPMFQGIIDFLNGVFTGNWEKIWSGLAQFFGGVWEGLKTMAKAPLNFIINMLNKVIDGLNSLQVPDWVPGIGGMGINLPKIPQLWKGTNFTLGGPTLVGEQGPELVNMPRGASVMPSHKTRQLMSGGAQSGSKGIQTANIFVELDGRTIARVVGAELTDIVRMKTGLSL